MRWGTDPPGASLQHVRVGRDSISSEYAAPTCVTADASSTVASPLPSPAGFGTSTAPVQAVRLP